MHFVDREAKYPNRWTIIKADGSSEVVTLVRNDEPIVEGTPMNAETLNTLSDVAGADIARQQAEAAREAAAGSATAAATSEINAAKHEEAAEKAAEGAASSASSAKTSEKNAKQYSEAGLAINLGFTVVNSKLCVVYDDGK